MEQTDERELAVIEQSSIWYQRNVDQIRGQMLLGTPEYEPHLNTRKRNFVAGLHARGAGRIIPPSYQVPPYCGTGIVNSGVGSGTLTSSSQLMTANQGQMVHPPDHRARGRALAFLEACALQNYAATQSGLVPADSDGWPIEKDTRWSSDPSKPAYTPSARFPMNRPGIFFNTTDVRDAKAHIAELQSDYQDIYAVHTNKWPDDQRSLDSGSSPGFYYCNSTWGAPPDGIVSCSLHPITGEQMTQPWIECEEDADCVDSVYGPKCLYFACTLLVDSHDALRKPTSLCGQPPRFLCLAVSGR